MNSDDIIAFSFLIGLGCFFVAVGILSRTGHFRWIYAMKGHPIFTPSALAYVYLPVGLIALFFGLIPFLPIEQETKGALIFYILLPLLIVTFVLAVWQPWWLKPKWLRWLENEHGDVVHLLWEDVRQDRWGWQRRVKTQEQMEAWVAEVRRRHNLS